MENASSDITSIKDFQLSSDADKNSDEYGVKVSKWIEGTVFGISNYYGLRNARFSINENWVAGRINVQTMFSDMLQFNGKYNYLNLSWECIMIVNRIVTGLIGKWMNRNEKISVSAIDPFSQEKKNKQHEDAEFILGNKSLLAQLQQQSGVPMVGADQFIPEDKDDLDLWASEHNRLPEEILYEKACNNVLAINGWFDTNKEKGLHDVATCGFIGTYTWMDDEGVVNVEWVNPRDAIYSWSMYNDIRDTSWRGRRISMKISVLRSKYGGKLTEEQLWTIAQTSKDYQVSDKITWTYEWTTSFVRPYDEWNVDCTEFEYKTLSADEYTMKVSGSGTLYVDKVQGKPQITSENKNYVKKDKWCIYRGVYLSQQQLMLEWGVKKNMIRPQDPKALGECEFSYSYYIYQNNSMRNLAIPEKIEEPVKMMILTRLKIQQCIANMTPAGYAINEDAIRALDYGLGEKNKEVDPVAQFFQTGKLYYNGKDAEGHQIPLPITELPNAGFMQQMQGLVSTYNYHYQVLKDELGEDPNLIQRATQPRVTEGNVQTSIEEADNATDYMYDAYMYCMEETSRKIACLLNDSVSFGATAYRDLMQEKDVKGKVFTTQMKMLPTKQQIGSLEAIMNQYIAAFPDFMAYIDPFKIMRIAEQDVKEAELYFRNAQKRYIKGTSEQKQQDYQNNAQLQSQSAQMAAQAKAQQTQLEGQIDIEKTKVTAESQNKTAVINMVANILSKGLDVPPTYAPFVNVVLQNVMLPLVIENEQVKQSVIASMQQAQNPQEEMQEPQGMNEAQGQEQPMQSQPPQAA